LIQVCGASDSQELPPNFIKLAKDAYTPDLIAASDCMLGQYQHDFIESFGR
jgi:L-arabinokinase